MKYFFARLRQKPPGSKNAQGMLEFALVLPVLLMMIIGVIEFSRLLFAWIIIENSTRFGIRYAITGNHDPQYCVDTNDRDPDESGVFQNDDGDPTTGACVGENINQEIDTARIPSIEDETRRIIIGFFYDQANAVDHRGSDLTEADPHYLNITVCSNRDARWFEEPVQGSNVYAECHDSEDPADSGQRVFVAADYNFNFIVLPVFKIEPSMIHLASYRQGFVEQFRGSRAIIPRWQPSNRPPPSP